MKFYMHKFLIFAFLGVTMFLQMAMAIDFPAADADGTVTLTAAGTYGKAIPSGTAKLVVNAGGEAVLSVASTGFTGPVVVKSGSTLKVTNKDAVSKASSITVENGGTLFGNFQSPGNVVIFKDLRIAGLGVSNAGAFKWTVESGGSGNPDALIQNLTLTADATINVASRCGIGALSGTACKIDLAGHTLTRIGSGEFMFYPLTMTPGTFKNTEGTITFQSSGSKTWDMTGTAEETIIHATAGTIKFWNTSYAVPYKVIFDKTSDTVGSVLSVGSGNNVPPRNTFSGPVELRRAITFKPAGKTVAFTGPLDMGGNNLERNGESTGGTMYIRGKVTTSGGNIRSVNTGLTDIMGTDLGSLRLVMQNGEIFVDVDSAYVPMFRCANGGGAYGLMRHVRGDLSFSAYDNPRVGERDNSLGAYIFEQGKMNVSNTFYLAAEYADSHGLFLQKGGHFDLKADSQTDTSKQFRAGACNAEVAFVQTGGTNDTAYGRIASNGITRFALSTKGGTNTLFAVIGSDTVFRTDTLSFACETNKTQGVIAINDGATFKARRFACPTTRATGSDVTLSLNGGVIYPLFHGGWANVTGGTADFLKRTPEHVVVFENGVVFDTSECLTNEGTPGSSQIPLVLTAPEGQGIASISIPTEAANATYRGPVPVEIRGPAGSYGAAAYADFDFSTKKLSKIVVVSPGCNYDSTTKIYVRSPDAKSRYVCPTFTLTGPQKSGGLVKRGVNGAQFYGACTYQGGTVVEGGMLAMYGNGFPHNTALTVRKGAIFSGGKDSSVTVSRLEGEGSVDTANGLAVTEALVLDADRVFADGATALTSSGKVTFSEGATVEVSVSAAQRDAYGEHGLVTVLSAPNGIVGNPRLRVNGMVDSGWTLINTGTALKFGPRHGLTVIVR